MFSQRQAMTARELNSAHSKLTALLESRDNWYDSTVQSVDSRMAAVRDAIPFVERLASTDTDMLVQSTKLRKELSRLSDLKSSMLSTDTTRRHLPKVSSVGPLSTRGRKFISVELPQFLADNEDAMGDLDELDTRAQDHAEIATMQLPSVEARSVVAHFRLAVNWTAKKKTPVRQETRVANRDVESLPDDVLFD